MMKPEITEINQSRRRSFVALAAGSTTALGAALGVSGCQQQGSSVNDDRQLQFPSLAAAEEELARLAQAKTNWPLAPSGAGRRRWRIARRASNTR